jgi:MerR family transcriptional regulator, light-induced transcriptional regulator
MVPLPDDALDLQAAADEIGVHYQTAYRWVRNGRLPSALVDGRYLIDRKALEQFVAARRTPSSPTRPSTKRLDTAAEKMHAALVVGDEMTARQLARTIIAEGASVADLIQQVLVPPLRRIGQDWHDGELSIWVEHRASAITERILGEVITNPRGRRRGTAMVAAVSGDRHSLATTMAAVTLRDNNWHVHHLGADMPPEELVRFCDEHDITVAVITLTNPESSDLALSTAAAIESGGTPAIVGGPGRTLADLVNQARTAALPTPI